MTVNLVKSIVVICLLTLAPPSVAQANDEAEFDTIFNWLLSAVTADQQGTDTEVETLRVDAGSADLYENYLGVASVAHNEGERLVRDLSGARLTAAAQAFPSEPGAILARDLPGGGNAFDDIFDTLLGALAAGQKRAEGESATRW